MALTFMVPLASIARTSRSIITHSNRVSSNQSLCCRETEFCRQRQRRRNGSGRPKRPLQRHDQRPAIPPIRRYLPRAGKISVSEKVRGGAERTQTACQARSRYRTGLPGVIHRCNQMSLNRAANHPERTGMRAPLERYCPLISGAKGRSSRRGRISGASRRATKPHLGHVNLGGCRPSRWRLARWVHAPSSCGFAVDWLDGPNLLGAH